MSCLQLQNLSFGFPDRILFSNVNIRIESGDRVGVIGVNGAGKTTLFKLVTGEASPTEGGVVIGRDIRLGYMEQYFSPNADITVYDDAVSVFSDVEAMENELADIHERLLSCDDYSLIERQLHLTEEIQRRDGLVYRAKTRSALLGLGFCVDDLEKPVKVLSGGQRSKLALCKLLLADCGLILLDEPTNHLDIDSISWLEDFLGKYKGAALIISHDRFFLDKTTSKTIEISNKKAYISKASYSEHKRLMEERQLSLEREYEKSTLEIKRIEAMIQQQKRFNQARNYVTIASKEKQIERIKDTLEIPDSKSRPMHFSFKVKSESGNEVLSVNGVAKAFNGNRLFSDVKLDVRRGERIFIMGPNGCGKSTLLKIIIRELKADSGFVKIGSGVKIGYFDQTISRLNNNNNVLDEIWGPERRMDETSVRKALASFLFFGDDVYKSIGALSGGERARVALLKLMLLYPNFLILDEPTNHLDIASREVLEKALLDFDGTILAVSHDRYLINRLATKIAVLEGVGLSIIEGNYDSYLQYKSTGEINESPVAAGDKKSDYKLRKERESEERKRKGRIERLENRISSCEEEISHIEEELSKPENASDFEMIVRLSEELSEKKDELDVLYSEWEELSS